jgi:hypothetical protein
MEFTIGINAKVDRFSAGFATMRRETELFKKSITGVTTVWNNLKGGFAAVGGYMVLGKLREVIAAVDEIKDTSESLNISTNLAQRIANVTDLNKASAAMLKLAEAQQKVVDGSDKDFKIAKQFGEIGVTLQDLKTKNFEQLFIQIADSMHRAALDANKLLALKEIFGNGSGELMKGFRKGIDSPLANRFVLSDQEMEDVGSWQDILKGVDHAARFGLAKILNPRMRYGALGNLEGMLEKPLASAYQTHVQGGPDVALSEREKLIGKFLESRTNRAKGDVATAEDQSRTAKEAQKLEKVLEQVEALKIQNAEKYRELLRSEMTAEQRINAIKKERLELQKQINSESDPLKKQKLLSRDLELRGDLSQLRKASENGSRMLEGDSMAKRGLFIGSTPSPIRQIEHQTIILKKVEKHLADLNKKADE